MRIDHTKIELLMAEQGINQTALAEHCGITRQNISATLTRGTCTTAKAVKIANALGVNIAEISFCDQRGSDNNKICPLGFLAGSHLPCRSDCAWYTKPENFEEGLCAITLCGVSSNFISGDIEGISTEVSK